MPTNESLKETLDHYRAQEKKLSDDLQVVRLLIRQLERDLGEPPSTSAETVINVADSLPPMVDRAEVINGRKPDIRPDEFYGMTQAEAARKYLKRIGHAVSFDELVTALQSGGCKVGGENPKRVLYISLIRNTRDFVPPQQGYIGLREFYPGAARLQRDKNGAPKKRGRPKKASARPHGRAPKKATDGEGETSAGEPKEEPSPLASIVRAILSDKQARSVDEILAAATTKLGRPVKKIGVLGTLNNRKSFEKVNGKYRLIK